MNVLELLDLAKSRGHLDTDSALAARLGVTKQAVSNWRHGTKTPDPVACEKLAEISGIPLHRVLGIVGEARAISTAEKRVWRKLAAAMFVSLLVAFPAQARANFPTNGHDEGAAERCIMRKVRRFLRAVRTRLARLARPLHGPGHDRPPPVLA